jgi:hypothetical protein
MAGLSRPKDGVASLDYAGHPRLARSKESKAWMPGTRPRLSGSF